MARSSSIGQQVSPKGEDESCGTHQLIVLDLVGCN